jgi:hypothetical protein
MAGLPMYKATWSQAISCDEYVIAGPKQVRFRIHEVSRVDVAGIKVTLMQ